MSTSPDSVSPPDQASLKTSLSTSRSRKSIVTGLRRKTSRLFGRNATNSATPDNSPQPIQPDSLKSKRSWFHSVGSRFHRHGHAVLESSESSQGIQVEMEETPHTTNPPSSSETTPPRSPMRRRRFRSRLRLHSLPARFRRRGVTVLTRSPSRSDEDKENFITVTGPAGSGGASNTGSWSSFRSGVQRAVRDMVDGNFRFSEDRNHPGSEQTSPASTSARYWPVSGGPPPRPPPRVPLGTLWTIVSADSSESVTLPIPLLLTPSI
ncbi:hypothetical protein B0I37DRAFT_232194 [Chaetomium sp. MPI-CAGE-AT-0009]|nr:hypothetical protein B0I37DRAFT_232194 [Chaetomium sp. MPI-CAGE-AT-0009]